MRATKPIKKEGKEKKTKLEPKKYGRCDSEDEKHKKKKKKLLHAIYK